MNYLSEASEKPLVLEFAPHRDSLPGLQGEFGGKLENDGRARSHLSLQLPVPQILILRGPRSVLHQSFLLQLKTPRIQSLTSSALLLSLTYLPSRSTSSTVHRPLAEACWVMRVRATDPPVKLEASLSVSLGRRLLTGEF